MYFGEQPVEQTEQAIVAHSIKLKHRALKKGHIITTADIVELQQAGINSIVVARLEAGDIDENTAAHTLAQAVTGEFMQLDSPFTGRCNIRTTRHGLLHVNREGIDQINRVHESLTIATLPHLAHIQPEDMIATIKIIPFAVDSATLESCRTAARRLQPILRVLPFRTQRVGFIQTRLAGTREQVLDKTTAVQTERLADLDYTIVRELRCQHDTAELTQALQTLLKMDLDVILIFGASAIVDRRDIIPMAIINSGGEVLHYGMPTDPGNLLLLGRHGKRPVLGLPGCARSPKLNGLDLVLQRLAADLPVTSADIMAMGTGGLLQEIKSRPQPRE
ncbi:MAG: molybdopterin-binding protein [Gammaproteobacteria bacterium]|nr:molybdopterin-binding protein [Gammaproteobacteria bacterium]